MVAFAYMSRYTYTLLLLYLPSHCAHLIITLYYYLRHCESTNGNYYSLLWLLINHSIIPLSHVCNSILVHHSQFHWMLDSHIWHHTGETWIYPQPLNHSSLRTFSKKKSCMLATSYCRPRAIATLKVQRSISIRSYVHCSWNSNMSFIAFLFLPISEVYAGVIIPRCGTGSLVNH